VEAVKNKANYAGSPAGGGDRHQEPSRRRPPADTRLPRVMCAAAAADKR
jgi:hypothetical protein